jgi:3-hydroxyacyl-CoA dehydrogenase
MVEALSLDIRNVACVGVGTIGHSWATLFAIKGCNVTVYDVNQDLLRSAMERIRASAAFLAEKGFVAEKDAEAALKRIKVAANMSECVS